MACGVGLNLMLSRCSPQFSDGKCSLPHNCRHRAARSYKCRMADSQITRMRERARQMRRVAAMAHDAGMIEILLAMAHEAEPDADQLQAELEQQIQQLPPQT